MSFALTSNFFLNARGLSFLDGGGVAWSFNKNTNVISATASSTASGANPTAKVGLTAVNGTADTFTPSDGAPALDQAIVPSWSGQHQWSKALYCSVENGASFILNSSGSDYGLIQNDGADSWSLAVNTSNAGGLGTPVLSWTTTNVTVHGPLGWNGVTPPAQVTGFGTPAGASVVASFSGTAATNAQMQATIAQILTIMKAHGMIGA